MMVWARIVSVWAGGHAQAQQQRAQAQVQDLQAQAQGLQDLRVRFGLEKGRRCECDRR